MPGPPMPGPPERLESLNDAESAPPVIENETVSPSSPSVAASVVTEVVFSSTSTARVAPALNIGVLSLVLSIVTVISRGVELIPLLSVALTVTLYILSVLASAGFSKSGIALSVRAPEA